MEQWVLGKEDRQRGSIIKQFGEGVPVLRDSKRDSKIPKASGDWERENLVRTEQWKS